MPSRWKRLWGIGLAAATALGAAHAQGSLSKQDSTPAFSQRDKQAGFANEGREYCAPTSVSDGLMCLAHSRGHSDLIEELGDARQTQVGLIKDLARKMGTDPDEGTTPDHLLEGLQTYLDSRSYRCKRLEIATWRRLDRHNAALRITRIPEFSWIRRAVTDPDCVVLLNVGWYRGSETGLKRHSGHWITAVGLGADSDELLVRNPLLTPQLQLENTSLHLRPFDTPGRLHDYFQLVGPSLPLGKRTSAAILDGVVVFSVEKVGGPGEAR